MLAPSWTPLGCPTATRQRSTAPTAHHPAKDTAGQWRCGSQSAFSRSFVTTDGRIVRATQPYGAERQMDSEPAAGRLCQTSHKRARSGALTVDILGVLVAGEAPSRPSCPTSRAASGDVWLATRGVSCVPNTCSRPVAGPTRDYGRSRQIAARGPPATVQYEHPGSRGDRQAAATFVGMVSRNLER